ncbi:hypothetical protein B0J11DRAFT_602835 [Dendryphion nanum]|uniref:Odorant receptor n=1 Tax=Dendryphion nanum TaxID=256645 RepID=A0A9P9E3R1_9PLEO|nr:hypothetical protein B0J11DRAFT_602835 [Dendryphion nanum]
MPLEIISIARLFSRNAFVVSLAVTLCKAACNCTDISRAAGQQDAFADSSTSQILIIISYMPIALYAEDLRVQNTLLNAILGRNYISTPMTGCIKDIHRIWNMRESELYGELNKSLPYTVASLRHGNMFPLVNMQVLNLGGLLEYGKGRDGTQHDGMLYRSTVVNVSFLYTDYKKQGGGIQWTYRIATCIQVIILLAVAAVCGIYKLHVCTLMITCMVFNHLVLLYIHHKADPVFGKAASRFTASREKVPGGATLDTHIVTAHANADEINVLCGYSSQLHSLTNIPIRTSNFRLVRRASRCLLMSLVVQAAALLSLVGNGTKQGLSSIIWLALYVMMNFAAGWLNGVLCGCNVLDHQPGTASNLPSMVFSGRKAAMAFIAQLPVTAKADKWAWADVFMPNNERRRMWEADMEKCRPYLHAKSVEQEEALLKSISLPNSMTLIEVKKAYKSPKFSKSLGAYMAAVGIDSAAAL